MKDVKWFKNDKEMRSFVKARRDGRTGIEFEVSEITEATDQDKKEVVIPEGTPPKKNAKKNKGNKETVLADEKQGEENE